MGNVKIMLVDDDEFVLNSLIRSLRREGYDLISFTDPAKALAYLEGESVDVIISDHRMPTVTGLDFLIQVRKRWPQIIRILLTGYADMDVAIRAVNEGKLFRFLTKPWNDEELKQILSHAVRYRGLLNRNQGRLKEMMEEDAYVRKLERGHPGIGEVKRDRTGAILIDEKDLIK